MYIAGRKITAVALVVLSLLLFLTPQTAEGRGFRRRFFARPFFRRRVFVQPRRVRPVRRMPVSQGCGNFGCVQQQRFNHHNRFRQFDPNGFTQADPRFKTLAVQDGQLFERQGGQEVAQLFIDPHSGHLFRIPIDPYGRIIGHKQIVPPNSLTFAQLSRFYFDNLDKFKSAVRDAAIEGNKGKLAKAEHNLRLVNQFLNNSQRQLGIERGGVVNFDISKMALPQRFKNGPYNTANVAVAALNATINQLTNQCENFCVGPLIAGNIPGQCQQIGQLQGTNIATNLTSAFSPRVIDFMTNAVEDPYACGDKSQMRLDYFVAATLVDPNKYYAIKQTPRTYEELAIRQGVSINSIRSAQAREAKMVVGDGESIVAKTQGPSRILGYQNEDNVAVLSASGQRRRGVAAMSLDFQNNSGAGVSALTGASQDLLGDPIGVVGSQAGGEKIDEQCNGWTQFSVQDGNGNRLNGVPANVASHGNIFLGGHEVSNPISCRVCHHNGFRGGVAYGDLGVRHKTNPFEYLPADEAARAQGLGYTTPQTIGQMNSILNVDYQAAQKRSNAWLRSFKSVKGEDGKRTLVMESADHSIPPEVEVAREYYKPLDDEAVARELGIPGLTVQQLANLRGPNNERLLDLDFVKNEKDKDGNPVPRKIKRDSFAKSFCKIKFALQGGGQAGLVDGGNFAGKFGGAGRSQFNHKTGRPY